MKQSEVEEEDRGAAARPESGLVTVLSGLPRPARLALIAMIVAVVGFGSLSQAGVLTPQFATTGGGSGGGSAESEAWSVLRNVGWRTWQVTAVDVTYEGVGNGSVDLVAFAGPVDTSSRSLPDDLRARSRSPVSTQLPLTVPPGDDLIVFGRRDIGPCAPKAFADGQPRRTQIAVRIATPLGERTISTPLSLEPCRG